MAYTVVFADSYGDRERDKFVLYTPVNNATNQAILWGKIAKTWSSIVMSIVESPVEQPLLPASAANTERYEADRDEVLRCSREHVSESICNKRDGVARFWVAWCGRCHCHRVVFVNGKTQLLADLYAVDGDEEAVRLARQTLSTIKLELTFFELVGRSQFATDCLIAVNDLERTNIHRG